MDIFSTGASAQGCGHVVRTIHQGIRSTSADFLAREAHGDNLEVATNKYVDKIILETDESGSQTASAVRVQEKGREYIEIIARKEIILTAGAYGTPAILLRSGIGLEDELAQVGIEAKINLPGVGKNLMDHMVS